MSGCGFNEVTTLLISPNPLVKMLQFGSPDKFTFSVWGTIAREYVGVTYIKNVVENDTQPHLVNNLNAYKYYISCLSGCCTVLYWQISCWARQRVPGPCLGRTCAALFSQHPAFLQARTSSASIIGKWSSCMPPPRTRKRKRKVIVQCSTAGLWENALALCIQAVNCICVHNTPVLSMSIHSKQERQKEKH